LKRPTGVIGFIRWGEKFITFQNLQSNTMAAARVLIMIVGKYYSTIEACYGIIKNIILFSVEFLSDVFFSSEALSVHSDGL